MIFSIIYNCINYVNANDIQPSHLITNVYDLLMTQMFENFKKEALSLTNEIVFDSKMDLKWNSDTKTSFYPIWVEAAYEKERLNESEWEKSIRKKRSDLSMTDQPKMTNEEDSELVKELVSRLPNPVLQKARAPRSILKKSSGMNDQILIDPNYDPRASWYKENTREAFEARKNRIRNQIKKLNSTGKAVEENDKMNKKLNFSEEAQFTDCRSVTATVPMNEIRKMSMLMGIVDVIYSGFLVQDSLLNEVSSAMTNCISEMKGILNPFDNHSRTFEKWEVVFIRERFMKNFEDTFNSYKQLSIEYLREPHVIRFLKKCKKFRSKILDIKHMHSMRRILKKMLQYEQQKRKDLVMTVEN